MKTLLLGVTLALLIVPATAQTHGEQDKQQVLEVLNTFRESIANKDSISFQQLFLNDSVPWIGITDEKSMALIRKYYPDRKAVDISSYREYMRFVATSKNKVEEKFFNVRIENDVLVASVTFDYSLWLGENPQNWGKASWELLKTDGKWRISYVSYSIHLPQVMPVPANFK